MEEYSTNQQKQTKSFEAKLEELEKIAKNLSQGNASLEQSLREFEQGISLSKECHKILQLAQQKVQVLLQDDQGSWSKETTYTKEL